MKKKKMNEKKGKYKHSSLRSTMYPEIVMKCDSSFLGDTLQYEELCEEMKLIKQGISILFTGSPLLGMKKKLNQTCTILCALGYENELFEMIKNGLLQYLNKHIRCLVYMHPPFYEYNSVEGLKKSLNEWKTFIHDLNNVLVRVERILFPITRMVINSYECILLRNVAVEFIQNLLRSRNDITKFAQQCIQLIVMWGFQRYWYHFSLNELPKLCILLDFMRELKIYTWIIEPFILKFCTCFYREVVQNWMQSHQESSPVEYINQIQKWTLRETKHFITCISQKTYTTWKEIRRKITFQNHLDYLFSTDISLKKNTHKNQYISCFLIFTDSEYLEKLYLQCEGTKTLERFYLYYQECVKKQVEEILYSPFDPSITFNYYFYQPFFNISYYPVFLYSFGYLIDFQKNLQWGVANLLKNNSHISQHMFLAWSKAFNKNKQIQVKVSRYIADYVHFLLTQKSIKHDLLLKELKNGMELLSYVQNPSLFQMYYAIDFRRRILFDSHFMLPLEKEMVTFLSQVDYNDTFSKKIQDILNTIEESFQINKTFQSYCKSLYQNCLVPFKFHFFLFPLSLYCDVWGHDKILNEKKTLISYHSPFFLLQNTFKIFYEKQFKGRKLNWNEQYGTCDVVVSVWNQNECIQYHCQMTEIQALCLLLFNNKLSYELNEIVSLTGYEENIISQHLESICHTENVLLWKTNDNKIVYTWNQEFRMCQSNVSFLWDSFHTKAITNNLESCIKEDSSYYIDALIMKIMKNKKKLSHSCLINCLKEKVQRDISESFFQERLQVLVEQAFLTESVEKPSFYIYCTHDI